MTRTFFQVFMALSAVPLHVLALAQERPPPTAQPVLVFKGHEALASWSEGIRASFLEDGRSVASADPSGEVKVWDANTGAERRSFRAEPEPVAPLLAGRAKVLASGARTRLGEVTVWDVETGRKRGTLREHERGARALAVNPNASLLVLADYPQCRTVVADLRTGKAQHWLPERNEFYWSAAFSPDGKLLAVGIHVNEEGKMPPGHGVLELWEVGTWRKLGSARGRGEGVAALVFSPDGNALVSGSHDGKVTLWETSGPRERHVFEGEQRGTVEAVAFAPNGQLIASGGTDGLVRLWDVATGREVRTLAAHPALKDANGNASVTALEFSADGKRLLTAGGDGLVKLWDVAGLLGKPAPGK